MELWDIYDIDRIPTHFTARRGDRLSRDEYHMVIHVVIFSPDGRMLIQQRSSEKRGWAGKWDVTCGGCAIAGETSRDAAARELFEELGLRLDFRCARTALTVNFDHGFDDFYLIELDPDLSSLVLQKEEVQAVRWATMEEIFSMIDGGSFIPFFKSFIHLLFDIRKKPDCLNI